MPETVLSEFFEAYYMSHMLETLSCPNWVVFTCGKYQGSDM